MASCAALGCFVDWSTTFAQTSITGVDGAAGGQRPLLLLTAIRLAAAWRADHSKRVGGRVPGWAPPAIVTLARFESSVADQASILGTSTKKGGISHLGRS